MANPHPPVPRDSLTRPPVPRASHTTLAALALLLACDPEPPARTLEPYNPPRSVYAPQPSLLPDLPNLERTTCRLTANPAHRLVLTAGGPILDDVTTDLESLPAALADLGELSLQFDPDLPYAKIRPILAALPANLRLWIGVRISMDREIHHLPISAPQYGPRPPRTTPLPPGTYAFHLAGRTPDPSPIDPLVPQIEAGKITGVFVSATPDILWGRIAVALAGACEGATLIDPSTDPPYQRVKLPKSITAVKPKVTGRINARSVERLVQIHLATEAPYCFNRMLNKNPRARGRVDLTVTIDAAGKVPTVTIDRSTVPDPDAATCLANHATRWAFPKPEQSRVTVSVPIEL